MAIMKKPSDSEDLSFEADPSNDTVMALQEDENAEAETYSYSGLVSYIEGKFQKSKDNRLSGILVAENARRALAILVENKSLFELLEKTNMLATSIESNNSVSLITTNKNFSSNGKTLRKQGVIRKIYCVF